jgi:tetratricopeptide (TPR) repeat protein
MTMCYQFHDMMLGRLMNLAGDDTTVVIVSDHGFHCDELRPQGTSAIKGGQPVAWHRPYGVVAAWGPRIKKDERIYGASLLDVAPTVLTMLGLPVAEDMDGQPLTQIFEQGPFEVPTIETYEEPSDQKQAETAEDDPRVAEQVLKQLKMEQFRQGLERRPDDKGAKIMIASCLMSLGRLDDAEAMAKEVFGDGEEAPQASLYLGMICMRRGETDKALEHLRAVEDADASTPGLYTQLGTVYLRQGMWAEAESAFDKALEDDPENAEALDGLGVAYRNQGRSRHAVHAHMRSVALLHYRPQTHINLGLALAECRRFRWAERAFTVAIEMSPNNPLPHRCLAQLYARALNDREKAEEHRRRAEELRAAMTDPAGGG